MRTNYSQRDLISENEYTYRMSFASNNPQSDSPDDSDESSEMMMGLNFTPHRPTVFDDFSNDGRNSPMIAEIQNLTTEE